MAAFKSDRHRRLFEAVVSELPALGYDGNLVIQDYEFTDWFQSGDPRRTVPVAAFGQLPPTYQTACIAVVVPNGKAGAGLISDFRALGASVAFEVREDAVAAWRVGSEMTPDDERRVILPGGISAAFARYSSEWSAESILRGKNIGLDLAGERQLDFFDLGLIPALEGHIREKLDRTLNEVLAEALRVYGKEWETLSLAEAQGTFRLAFRFLAAKVLHDRGFGEFAALSGSSDPAEVLRRVESYYGQSEPVLYDRAVWQAVFPILWSRLNFQNLSVEVLAYIYEHTLVTKPLRKKLGIHGTPSSIARYIVRSLPIEKLDERERIFLEPCSGHGIFLVAALQRLGSALRSPMTPEERHRYFVEMLEGYEIDSFALEVSWLCLMLADFPNSNGWRLRLGDVFLSSDFRSALENARVIVCNPPYEGFSQAEKSRYAPLRSDLRPVELLERVLDALHPEGMLGFVLPNSLLRGAKYRNLRRRLAERFGHLEIVELPESNVFFISEHRSVLLIAHEPSPGTGVVSITYKALEKTDREPSLVGFAVTREDHGEKTHEEVAASLAIPPLIEVWKYLEPLVRMKSLAGIHRGIEWQNTIPEDDRHSDSPRTGYQRGYWSVGETDLLAYQSPRPVYLNVRRECLRRGMNYPWSHNKAFVNYIRRSRKGWRYVALIDYEGLYCTDNFFGVWSKDVDTTIEYIAAILNNPLAAAYVACHATGKHNSKNILDQIPVPRNSEGERDAVTILVRKYLTDLAEPHGPTLFGPGEARDALLEVDSIILKGYGLPESLQLKVLSYLRHADRPVAVDFKTSALESRLTADALTRIQDPVEAWDSYNDRRAILIDKELNEGLTPEEEWELKQLQDAADSYLDRFEPLPLEDLSWLDERVRQLKLEAEQRGR